MHQRARLIPIAILLIAMVFATWWWATTVRTQDDTLKTSGTIETIKVHVSAEMGGRVIDAPVQAGDRVQKGEVLIQLDSELLAGQLAQARASVQAAQANYDLLAAGPTRAQFDAAEATVTRAETALDSLNEQLEAAEEKESETADEIEELNAEIVEAEAALVKARSTFNQLPPGTPADQLAEARAAVGAAEATAAALPTQLSLLEQLQAGNSYQISLLESQIDLAEATLDSSRAQRDLLLEGARPEQLEAAQAQVEAAQAAVALLELQITRQTLTAPLTGVVLSRGIEPGETALPGATLVTLGQLYELTITVYVPQDRYGEIALGQEATLRVDSFPDRVFTAVVQQIADKAEFTPRNVQTAKGRATTVFAIHLDIISGENVLKPGMPADVDFGGED